MKIKADRFAHLPPDTREWAIRHAAEIAKEIGPLLGDLAAVGYVAEELDDLRRGPIRDDKALEVLVRHLQMPHSPGVRMCLAGALDDAKPRARRWGPILIDLLSKESNEYVKHTLTLAMENALGPSELPVLKRILDEHRGNPGVRATLLSTWMKLSKSNDVDLLLGYLADEPAVAVVAARALARMKVPGIRPSIEKWAASVTDPEWRGIAKRVLKQFCDEVKVAPRHLVSNRRKIPPSLAEWSVSLGLDEVKAALEALSPLVEAGFGVNEVEEVVGVAEDMSLDATRTFCFPIMVAGFPSEIWVSLFMDEEDLPDLAIFGPQAVVERMMFEPS